MSNLDEKLKEYVESQFFTPDNSVYHYTKEPSYCEIFRCEYLKLNSHFFLNEKDKTNKELQTSAQLIINELKKESEFINLIDRFEKFIEHGITCYTLSLSTSKSVFTANKYGNYCIEFDSKLFKKFQSSHNLTLFSQVEYDKKKQESIISKIFEIYKQWKSSDNDPIVPLFTWLIIVIPLFKGEEHKNDDECRLIQVELYYPDGKIMPPLASKKIIFSHSDVIGVTRE